MIVKRYCDRPMAEKKELLEICDHNCRACVACIEVDDQGHVAHAVSARGAGDMKLWIRNQKIRKYYDENSGDRSGNI